jgi:hypothetical protein
MSVRRKISIKNAVSALLDNIGMARNNMIPVFQVWAKEGEQKIGSYYQYKRKIYVLDVENCAAQLPCEVVSVNALLLGDHGCDCSLIFEKLYHSFAGANIAINPLNGFTVLDNSGSCARSSVSWNIQNNAIIVQGNYDGSKITIEALTYEVDNEGWMLVNENHVDALAQYCELKWMERAKHKKGTTTVQYSGEEMRRMGFEWNRKCALARGEDGSLSESDRAEVVSMVNNPYSGLRGSSWLWNDPYYTSY